MRIGIVGLGKMGGKIALRLLKYGHEVVVYNRSQDKIDLVVEQGALGFNDIDGFIEEMNKYEKSVIWVMIPSGEVTNNMLLNLGEKLKKGSILIDGGNTNYKDTIETAKTLKKKDINFLDIGTSGGLWGYENGYCLMAGGDKDSYEYLVPLLTDLSAPSGFEYFGDSGSGHFVKMVHNGIEYGMMQAYAEGFEILKSKEQFNLDLDKVTNVWRHGSIIESFLLDLTKDMFKEDPDLSNTKGWVADSGEGRWTVLEALENNVSAPVITLSLMQRFRSRKDETFTDKVLARLRNEFGGHEIKKN
ncbi:MAG: decarboxylating 6-phosphogluconate dehydrogenase [Psychrilyobacter sp.]|nr:decarboxylating 6-phosphogluconate dehydrogenase [Psychrilyobacter sp.]